MTRKTVLGLLIITSLVSGGCDSGYQTNQTTLPAYLYNRSSYTRSQSDIEWAKAKEEQRSRIKLGMTQREVGDALENRWGDEWRLVVRYSNGCEILGYGRFRFTFCDGKLTDWMEM